MNDLYHWNAEVMVHLEMEEFRKEMDSIRLLHDAELSNPNLFERIAIGIANAMVRLGNRLRETYTNPHQAYQVTSNKLAP